MKLHRHNPIVLLFSYCLGAASFLQAAPLPDVETSRLHLYLLIGQSNMAGRGVLAEQDKQPHRRVRVLNRENRWAPAVEPLHFDKPKIVGVGPGLAFGKAMAEANPDATIGLIPCAVGGSPISVWKPRAYYDPTGVYPYDDAIKRCKTAKRKGVLKGVLWHQGESDSNPQDGPLYRQRLTESISRLRADLEDPNLPFVAGLPADLFVAERPEANLVIDAIKTVAQADERMHWVSARGLTCKADRVHFDADSARTLGRRYAEAVIGRKNVTTDSTKSAHDTEDPGAIGTSVVRRSRIPRRK